MPLLVMALLLAATTVVPKNEILVKGAVPSASDSSTPVPEDGRIAGGRYRNAYFGLAYPMLNIQALTGVRDDEQGLASGLVGSSFQIGGAVVLALATATILAHTPTKATPAASVHAFTAGVYISLASACLLVLIAVAGWRSDRRHAAQPRAAHGLPARPKATEPDPLDLAA